MLLLKRCVRTFNPKMMCRKSMSSNVDPQQEAMDKENLILVSPKDEYRGICTKRDSHTWNKMANGDEMLHRAFSLFVFNSNGGLLLQKRAATKLTFPGLWANTCCSHPLHVEDEMKLDDDAIGVRKAAERKIVQELGVAADQVSADKIHYVTRLLYKAQDPINPEWGEHELDYILFMRGDLVPFPNLNEVEATQYVSKLGLKLLLKKSEMDPKSIRFSPWFLILAKGQLFEWWDNLDNLEKITDKQNIVVAK